MTARFLIPLFLFAVAASATARAGEWSGEVGLEARLFNHEPLDPRQRGDDQSLQAELEYYRDSDDGLQRFAVTPFVRVDREDPERTHADLRELYWRRSFEQLDLYVGIRKVFWGVTESRHLVDVINQTDLVENIDGEDKLGQPMVSADWITDEGTLSVYVMPWFRERTFPGIEGRLRPLPPVDTDAARYESGAGKNHVDLAVRWSRYIGDFDIGLSHFSGTGRDPRFVGETVGGESRLVPYYVQVERTGLDLQATKGSWLWKLEAVSESDDRGRHTAAVGGLEYTFYGMFGSAADVGVLAEYLGDDRGDNALTPFQNDLFVGTRITLNDVQDSHLLAGVITDLEGGGRFFNVEAGRRIGADWTLDLEVRVVADAADDPRLFNLRRDGHAQLLLTRHF